MAIATLTSKGQLTVPQRVRQALGLEAGDKVDFVADPMGGYRVVPVRRDVTTLRGRFAGRVQAPVTLVAMRAAIETEAAERARQGRRRGRKRRAR